MRDNLRLLQAHHRRTVGAPPAAVFPIFVDFTSPPPDFLRSAYTLGEAKDQVPSVRWDELVRDFYRQKAKGEDVGPIVAAMYPHPQEIKYHAIVLKKPLYEIEVDGL